MLTLKIGEKELKVKYGYEATLKTRLLSKLAGVEIDENDATNFEKIEDFLLFLPDFLLVGLQRFHKDEYGFDYDSEEEKAKQTEKAFELIEEYCEGENNAINLFRMLQNEMISDGFLAGLFQEEQAKAKKTKSVSKSTGN